MKGITSESRLVRVLSSFINKKGRFRLTFRNQNHQKEIGISNGQIVYAFSNLLKDKLSEVLFKAGKLNQDQYMLATELSIVTKKRIGEILVQEGFLPPHEVAKGLRYQVRKILCDLFAYPEWKVKVTDLDSDASITIMPKLSLIEALMAGLRSVDNLSVLCDALPRKEDVLEHSAEQETFMERFQFTKDESLLILLIDGKKRFQEILEESRMLEYHFYKTLYPLLALKFVKAQRKPVEVFVRDPVFVRASAAYADCGDEAALSPESGPDPAALEALFEEAKFFISTEQFSTAANKLKQLIHLDSRKSAYYYYLGLALDHIPGQNKEAEKILKMAIRLENYNARYYLALGYLYLNRNMERQAREQFLTALRWDPNDPYVKDALESLEKSRKKGIGYLTSKLFC